MRLGIVAYSNWILKRQPHVRKTSATLPRKMASSSPQPENRPLLTGRDIQLAVASALLLAISYLVFGHTDWTVKGEVVLRAQADGMVAVALIPETDIALVAAGQPAEVLLRAYPGAPLPAQVQSIDAVANQSEDNARVVIAVTLTVTPPAQVALRDGFTGSAEIVVARDRAGLVYWGRLSRYLLQRF